MERIKLPTAFSAITKYHPKDASLFGDSVRNRRTWGILLFPILHAVDIWLRQSIKKEMNEYLKNRYALLEHLFIEPAIKKIGFLIPVPLMSPPPHKN